MKIVIFGSTSFAARGLVERLIKADHEVWGVNRREDSRLGPRSIQADPFHLVPAAEALGACEVLINFLLVNGTGPEGNLRYCEQLRAFIQETNPRRVIHVSSIVALPPVAGVITEAMAPEPNYKNRDGYAKVKIGTELWFSQNITDRELVIVRPGFLIAPGLSDPIVGMGKGLPTKQVLGLGSARSIVPLLSRDRMDEAMVRLVEQPLAEKRACFNFVNPASPTRREYLEYCVRQFALGTQAAHAPAIAWYAILGCVSVPISLLKRRAVNLVAKFRYNLKVRTYDVSKTEAALGLSLAEDWRPPIDILEGQERNYDFERFAQAAPSAIDSGDPLLYVGVDRVVRDRHVPALRNLKFGGEIQWFDPSGAAFPGNLRHRRTDQLSDSNASRAVIASPATIDPAILNQLGQRKARILLEPPLALNAAHRDTILETLAGSDVFVLHSFRYKSNVLEMFRKLREINSGKLLHTSLHFDNPPVSHEGVAWKRDERRARTLLMHYALPYLDMAWLFASGRGRIIDLEFHRNAKGATERISGSCQFENMHSRFFVRQGARQRRCHIDYVFQNYTIRLRFSPDTCTLVLGRYTAFDDFSAAFSEVSAMARRAAEKLKLTALDPSYERVLAGFLNLPGGLSIEELRAPKLHYFYDLLFEIGGQVYA